MSMHIERYGQGERILFIHGSGWNTHMWYSQRDYLKSSMEVILVDLPGHGESSGNGCDSVEGYRDAVYEMIRSLISKDAILPVIHWVVLSHYRYRLLILILLRGLFLSGRVPDSGFYLRFLKVLSRIRKIL